MPFRNSAQNAAWIVARDIAFPRSLQYYGNNTHQQLKGVHPNEKNTAFVLILALNIMFTSAFTEVRNFDLSCIIDMDDNLLYTALDDNTAADTECNPCDSIPYITMSVDDEAMTFEMGTADMSVSGTVEVIESTDTEVVLQFTPDGEGVASSGIYTNDENGLAITLIDEANEMLIVMTEIEAA